MATFAVRFKELREAKDWTQDDAARELGVSRSTIGGYESPSKYRVPREEMLVKIAEKFGVSIDYLLGKTDEDTQAIVDDMATFMKGLSPDKRKEFEQYVRIAMKGFQN
ncbi:helix-turn-helix domain-containing protein [Brevibacillus reuszeri]|uniref:helix-turn-helix domain-containing protein n=1 Tax=Brevibacillus reuszeri TaxID=54915 RepID=UPI000CCC952D|nr:helix-turn-helix transcriptional regulator [Brevibacillus reuszeri]